MNTSQLSSDLHETVTSEPASPAEGRGWLWAGLGASVLGFVASNIVQATPEPAVYDQGAAAVVAQLEGRGMLNIGASIACVSAFLLIPFLIGLASHVRRLAPAGSSSAEVLRSGGAALVAGLMITTSLRYVAAGGLPGGIDADYYTATDTTAMAMLGSQMQFAGWLPGLVVTGVVAHAAWRHGVAARWVAVVLAFLTALSAAATLVVGLPYSAGFLVPLALIVLCVALVLDGRRGRQG